MEMRRSNNGDTVLLLREDGKRMLSVLNAGAELQTNKGVILHDDLIGLPWGSSIETHLGTRFFVIQPTVRDLLLQTKRNTQIMFPKDIGYTLLRLSVGPGKRVVEAGTGSGALTLALAWMVGEEGRVFSYERREEAQELAMRNLEKVGLDHRVDFRLRDIQEGFEEQNVDALFLDLLNPQDYLSQVKATLVNGGQLGSLLPTANQVSLFLEALADFGFGAVEVCEILLRFYKPIPRRLRPVDRMVAHTGYLVFARSIVERDER
jgi:tRNA (adenine57-N1/adenine58-N1)-methyltransferase